MKKYDERETLFSRINLEKGTKEYNEFYSKHKDLKHKDDSIRRISFRHVLRKSEEFKDLFFPLTANNKLYIKNLHDMVVNYEVKDKVEIPKGFSKNIKEIAKYYGATDVGIVKLDEYSYYSHSGGLSESLGIDNYNDLIKPKYKTGIIFTVKMDLEFMNRAPNFEELLTTEQAYLRVAEVSARLALYLKSIGYDAYASNSETYLAPLVPLAFDAGLGEIGMSNHLVTLEHGDNVRLGAVFTNMELDTDKPVDFGLHDFCKKCALCLINCPSNSITHLPRMVNGRQFYKFDENSCFDLWVKTGTDCGVCVQSCPFTQGLDLDRVAGSRGNDKLIEELVQDHIKKHTRRKYTKEDLDIVKIGEDE